MVQDASWFYARLKLSRVRNSVFEDPKSPLADVADARTRTQIEVEANDPRCPRSPIAQRLRFSRGCAEMIPSYGDSDGHIQGPASGCCCDRDDYTMLRRHSIYSTVICCDLL